MTIKGKELIERISDKEYSEDLIKELEKYEIKKPKSVWELKNDDEIWMTLYYDVNGKYVSYSARWHDWGILKQRRELGKIHLTKERAELHARVLSTELAIKKWKRENDNVEFDWNDKEQEKHRFMYDGCSGRIIFDRWRLIKFANTIYFSSELKARHCINDIGEERIIEWIKWEDNDK